MTYNPESYWHERGANYVAPGEVAEIPEIDSLKYFVGSLGLAFGYMLEVGSGYGRIYTELKQFVKEIDLSKYPAATQGVNQFGYQMCDFVESMRYKCLRNTDILPDYWDGNELPYNDNEFDLVISFSVLLHVPPDNIEQVLREHVRVSKKYFFIATYNGGLDRLAPHCFEHDYEGLFKKLNLKIANEKHFQAGLRANWLLEK